MLAEGTKAPDIDAETTEGTRFKLSEQTGLCTVVYFFPKAFTPGCTRETEHFRANYPELALAGATIIGVSTDDLKTQCEFAKETKAPFPLIADADASITRAFDVNWPLLKIAQRVTFVIDASQTIRGVFHHELQVKEHRDDVLRLVDQLFRARTSPAPLPNG